MKGHNIRVFIADDHSFIVDVLKSKFNQGQDFEFTGRASSIEELFMRLNGRTDLLLLDKMGETPEMLTVIEQVQTSFPLIKIVLLTGKEDLSFAKQALETGAKGYLSKSLSMEEVCRDLMKIHAGGLVIDLGQLNPAQEDECAEAKKLITPTSAEISDGSLAHKVAFEPSALPSHPTNRKGNSMGFDISFIFTLFLCC